MPVIDKIKQLMTVLHTDASSGETTEINMRDFVDADSIGKLVLYSFAINAGINVIAGTLARCEIRTFLDHREVKGDEYYLWNLAPNRNQSAPEFLHKLIWHLIYRGEALVVSTAAGDLLVADSFYRDRYAFYPDSFRDVTVCADWVTGASNPYTFQRPFRADDVLYFRLQNRNIVDLLESLCASYDELLEAAVTKFERAGGERGVLNIAAKASATNYGTKSDGTKRSFNDVYTEIVGNGFKNYFKSSNAVVPLWEGFDYVVKNDATKRSTSDVADVVSVTDEIYDRVANAFQIAPAFFKGDIADISELTRNTLTFAVEPYARLIEREINRKRYGKRTLTGSYVMIDTSRIMHREPIDEADKIFNLIGAGYSPDEIRVKLGDAPLGEDWSRAHYISKNFEGLGQAGKEEGANGRPTEESKSGRGVAVPARGASSPARGRHKGRR